MEALKRPKTPAGLLVARPSCTLKVPRQLVDFLAVFTNRLCSSQK